MKCRILRWLLGIWLVQTVAARHILSDDENNGERRLGRDQFHQQQPFHPNYNTFRSTIRRAPPQVPNHRYLVEPEPSTPHHYSNYFTSNTDEHQRNQPNLNVYSAVRLHGALEARARAEPGSSAFFNGHLHNNYQQPDSANSNPRQDDRQRRRDTPQVDETLSKEEDLARFSFFNSYFDNPHSINALNNMKCVTPTGSPGFCSTFRGCVPSFFTKEGDLEAPALAELISTSIGYCTTNVTHHFIREQRVFENQEAGSREERRYNSVANRIICCPGAAPMRNPNQDPDQIFLDYLESQKQKTSTTTTTTTTQIPLEPDNAIDGGDNQSEPSPQGDGSGDQVEGSQNVPIEAQTPEQPQEVNQSESSGMNDKDMINKPVMMEDSEMSKPIMPEDSSDMMNKPVPEKDSEMMGKPDSMQDTEHSLQPQGTQGPSEETQTDSPTSPQPQPPSNVAQEEGESSQEGNEETPSGASTSPPGSQQHEPEPSPGGEGMEVPPGETVVDSRPIVIVKPMEPEAGQDEPSVMPIFPNFPAAFPPMPEDPIPPVDDSSLELQRPGPPRPPIMESSEASSSSVAPSESSYPPSQSPPELPQTTAGSSDNAEGQLNDDVTTNNYNDQYAPGHTDYLPITSQPEERPATTQRIPPSGDDSQHQQDESDMTMITTSQPQQHVSQDSDVADQVSGSASGTSTPSSVLDAEDDDGNGAVTILPVVTSPPAGTEDKPQPVQITGTQMPEGADVATTMKTVPQVGDQNQQGVVGVNEATTLPSGAVGTQEIEMTTIPSQGSQEAVDATTLPSATATTLRPGEEDESDESDESDEDVRRPTTVASQAEEGNDIAPTTTVAPESPSQDDEVAPAHPESPQQNEIGSEGDSTTVRIGAGQQVEAGREPTFPPQNVGQESEPGSITTYAPPQSDSQVGGEEEATKIILNPGSEISDGGYVPGPVRDFPVPIPVGSDDQQQPEMEDEHTSMTMQPFPGSSPASGGDAESDQTSESGSQQFFPGSEPSTEQSQSTLSPVDGQQAYPGAEPVAVNDEQSNSGSEQSFPSQPVGTTEESSQTTDDRESTRIPTTGAPIPPQNEQDDSTNDSNVASGDEPVSEGAASVGAEQPSGSANDGGSESSDPASEPSPVSGDEPIPSGSESTSQGSESNVGGTESSVTGSEPSYPGAESTTQGGDSISSGSESIIPYPGSESDTGASTDSQSSSNPGSESTSTPDAAESEPAASVPSDGSDSGTSQPSVPSHDDASTSGSNSVDNEPSLPSSTLAPSASAGSMETENVPQDALPPVQADNSEDAPPMQGSSQSDSTLPTHPMQTPEAVSTEQAPAQDDSEPEMSGPSSSEMGDMMNPSTSSPSTQPAIPPSEPTPNYQILKACKFQTYFRAMDETGYSYRHYPWLATIVGGTRPFSSGTLITDRHILTASHFLANITVSDVFNMRIHVGYRTSYSGQTEGPYAVRKVRKVIRHKGFSFEKLYNDIAVLVLDRPVRFTEDIYPVCLSSNRNAYADGAAEAIETGWIEDPRTYTISQHHNYVDPHIQKYFSFGYKNITWRLQEAPQRVRTNQECQSNYGFLENNGIKVTDSMVCAGSGDTRSCAFRGNSGAPLFIRNEDDKLTEQIGIVSFGIGCGHFPFVFTRVESFLPWLDRVVYNSR